MGETSATRGSTAGAAETTPLLDPGRVSASPPAPEQGKGSVSGVPENPPSVCDGEILDSSRGEAAGVDGEPDQPSPAREGLPDIAAKLPVLMPAIGIGIFLCALDQLLAVATYAKIGSDLGALNSTSWIATAYFLTLTSCQPLYGKLSDIFGRKQCLLFAYAVFALGCLGCGLARSMPQLVFSRAVAGVGGGGMNAVVSILLTDIVPLSDRGLWQGYLNILYACGTATGAPLGGLLADSLGWRWSFLFQVPVCLVAFVTVRLVLHLPSADTAHWREKLSRIDFLGAAALVSAVLCLLLGLDAGSNHGWARPATLASLAAGLVLSVLFILVETRVASHPFAPGHVIFDRSLAAAYACNFFGMAGHMPILFYLPLLYQAVAGVSAVGAGTLLIPGSVVGVAASLGSGALMKRTGRYYWINVAGLLLSLSCVVPLCLSGLALSGTAGGSRLPLAGTTLGLAMASTAAGSFTTTTLIALLSNSAPQDSAVVVACSYLFRSLGSSIGISIASAVLQQVLRVQLAARLGDGDAARQIEESVRQSLDNILELEPAVAAVVRGCYQTAVVSVFVGCAAFLAPAFTSSLFVKDVKIRK